MTNVKWSGKWFDTNGMREVLADESLGDNYVTSEDVLVLLNIIDVFQEKREAAESELAKLREESRWIPVSERLPEENLWVLVYQDGAINCMGYSVKYGFQDWTGASMHNIIISEITHWRPPSPATGAARMNLTYEQRGARTPKVRHYQWRSCEQCGSPYLSNALRYAYCSPGCKRTSDRERDPKVDILDQAYNVASWLIVKDATPEDNGGFVNGRSRISTPQLVAMACDRNIAEGTIVENVQTRTRKVVDYSKIPYSRENITVNTFLRNI